MAEVKFSKTLSIIAEYAKNLSDQKNAPLTASRLLVGAIDFAASDTVLPESKNEVGGFFHFLKENNVSAHRLRAQLVQNIVHESSTAAQDSFYIKNKLRQSATFAEAKNGGVIIADILLLFIVNEPDDVIKGAMERALSTEDSLHRASDTVRIIKREDRVETGDQPIQNQSSAPKKIIIEGQEEGNTSEKKNEERVVIGANGGAIGAAKDEMKALVDEIGIIRKKLKEKIFGQDNAINTFVTGYFQSKMMKMLDKNRSKPGATFLFAGPPGVGKTYLAESVAEILNEMQEMPFQRFDMSEYSNHEAAIELIGSDAVYKDSDSGNLTKYVMKNPKCILLFDEIEKAHISIIHLFLQILDAGRVRDSKTDEEVSFKDVIIIFTTNAGKQLYEDSESGDFSTMSRKVIIKALEKDVNPTTGVPYFPAAICSRFASGNVVMFNHIMAHDLRMIAKKKIESFAENLAQESGIEVSIDEKVFTALLLSEGSAADARTVKSRAEAFFNDELYELLRLVSSEKASSHIAGIEKIRISVDCSKASKDIAGLFAPTDKLEILVISEEATVDTCRSELGECIVHGAQSVDEAKALIKNCDISLVLIDLGYGVYGDDSDKLNIEDVESTARDIFRMIRERHAELPVYLLEKSGEVLNEEEEISFIRQGVRGVLTLNEENGGFAKDVYTICSNIHQQSNLVKLARENKLVGFETSQKISADGKVADIILFDFAMKVAVDSEDSKSIMSALSKPNVKFDEVIGAEDAKKELKYFVEYLKNPKKYMGTGVKAPKGVLLYGPPGTGKTMLAKAMASESNVTFIAAEGNQFLKKYVGEGPEKVHELFKTARKYAPAILFIDEIDAIAKERRGQGEASGGVEATLTAFLTEMDGFINDSSKPVFVLAATNFDVEPGGAKSLDPALMRRFDRRVYIDLPSKSDRIRFINLKKDKNTALAISDEEIDNIAMRSTGMSLADLDSVVELALRSAIREGSTKVTDEIFEEAFETYNSGDKKKWDISQLERVARHESGHAFLCWQGGETPSYLTIVARGNHGGYMQHADSEGKAIYTKDELLAKIRTSLGGRAAEIVYYGDRDGVSTGASGDLASATSLARSIVCTYGMDGEFGLSVIGDRGVSGDLSEKIRIAVNKILDQQMELAIKLVQENKDRIDALVAQLMLKNHLTGKEIASALEGPRADI